ncbi:MAG: glycosyltransferase [Porphyromonas sp.]|nr:glycosyltransferase [Porphyromonas sp.]
MPRLKSTAKLSVIITLLNEGEELNNTLKSLFKHTDPELLEVIVLDDASDDGYDYKAVCDLYSVVYVRNSTRKGVALSRDIGVKMASCQYIMLLDAHMRFYQSDWLFRLLRHLEIDSNRLICTQTVVLTKDEDNRIIQNELDRSSYGAYINFFELDRLFEPRWCFYKYQNILSPTQLQKIEPHEIPLLCVLGATYSFSKVFWDKIGGLYGLREYGLDESYLSIKAWLSGIIPVMVEDIYIGHIYRKKAPYDISTQSQLYNSILLALLFLPCSYIKGYLAVKSITNKSKVTSTLFEVYKIIDWIKRERNTFLNKDEGKSIDQIIAMNTQAFITESGRLEETAQVEFITSRIIYSYCDIKDFSLLSGRLGCILYLLIYSAVKKDSIIYKIAETYAMQTTKTILNAANTDEILLFEMGWFLVYTDTYRLLSIDLCSFIGYIDSVLSNVFIRGKLQTDEALRNAAELYFECRLFIEDKINIAEEIREYMNHFSRKNNSIRTFFFNLFDIKDFIKVKPSLFDISYFYVPSPLDITQYTLGLDGLAGIGIAELRFFEYETMGEYNKKQSL